MHRLCRVDELVDDGLLAIDPPAVQGTQGDSILLHRQGAAVRAWHNVCPHAGSRLDWSPGRFLRDGAHLVCAHHGAVFELAGGVCISGPCRGQALSALPVALRDGEIWIEADVAPHSSL